MRISDWSSDVCSSDLLAVHFGAARQQQCAVELVPVGLLRVPPDQDLALKDAARTIVEYTHLDFARAAFRHRMIDEGGVVDMLLAAQHVGAVEAAFDMTAADMGAQLVARQPAADAQHEAVVDGVVGERT